MNDLNENPEALPDRGIVAQAGSGRAALRAHHAPGPVARRPAPEDAQGILNNKKVRESLAVQGMTLLGTTPAATAQLFKAEMERYARIVKESGATAE